MQLRSTRDPGYFYVNWWLTDHCNWDCSYCHDILKNGSTPFPDIRDCKNFLDQVHRFAQSKSQKLDIDLTGGEVTLWPPLEDLLEHAKSLEARISLRTNASQDIFLFTSMIDLVDRVQIDFHPEHTTTSHFLLCLGRAGRRENLQVSVRLNALPDRWREIIELESKIKEKWSHFSVSIRMLFEDPIRNTKPMQYAEPQKEKIKRQSGDLIFEIDGENDYTDYQTLVLEDRNKFAGWACHIGNEQIIVDAQGIVRRGHCRQGGSLGHISDEIIFDRQPVLCRKPNCANAFDILATKIRD